MSWLIPQWVKYKTIAIKPGNAVGFKYVTNASVIVLHYLVQGNTRQILLQILTTLMSRWPVTHIPYIEIS